MKKGHIFFGTLSLLATIALLTGAYSQNAIALTPGPVKVEQGKNVSLWCKLNDYTKKVPVLWQSPPEFKTRTHNCRTFEPSSAKQKYKLSCAENPVRWYNLTIIDVQWADRGEYRCIITGHMDIVELQVYVPVTEVSLTHNSNNTAEPLLLSPNIEIMLTCTTNCASPTPTISWFENDQPFKDSPIVNNTESGCTGDKEGLRRTISTVAAIGNDMGNGKKESTIFCKAENIGESKFSTSIGIKYKVTPSPLQPVMAKCGTIAAVVVPVLVVIAKIVTVVVIIVRRKHRNKKRYGETAEMTTFQTRHPDVKDTLLNIGETAEMTAFQTRHPDVKDTLLNDGETAEMTASQTRHPDVKYTLLNEAEIDKENKRGESLVDAARYGNATEVRKLLSEGGDVDNERTLHGAFIKRILALRCMIVDWTALMLDSCDGHVDSVGALLKGGAEVYKENKKQLQMFVVSDGERQKLVRIDVNSLTNTKTAIRSKFNLFGDFDLLGKLPRNEHPFDIQNDDDLDDCREAESFLLKKRLNEGRQSDESSNSKNDDDLDDCREADTFLLKKRLNEGRQSDESSNSKVTLKMKSEAQHKFVSIDLECLRSTRNAISQKYEIEGDFQLLVKKNGVGKYIDVDDGDVLATLTKDDVLLMERTAQPSTPMEVDPASPQQQDAPESKALVEVKIGKTMYLVNEAPPGNSLVVRKETANLKLDFDLYGVIKKTGVVADCLRIARYGVANNPNLSSSMGDIVSGVMEITQKTKHAVMKFRMKGDQVLDDLVSGVNFLMENVDSVAMIKFKRIKGNTALLKDQSEKIRQEIDNTRKSIYGVLDKIKQETKEHAERKKETYKEIQKSDVTELRRRIAVAKKDTASSGARIKMHEKEIETDRERVKKPLDKKKGCGYGCWYGLCHHGWCTCLHFTYSECCYRCCSGGWRCHHRNRRPYWYWRHLYCHDHGHGVDEKRVKAEQALQLKAEVDRLKEIAERNKLREEEKKAIGELQNYIKDMKLKGDQLPADFTENALHATDGALRALNASVQSTVHFWDKMNQHCEAMGNTAAIADNVDNIKDDLVKREIYLNSPTFKSEAVHLFAKWVALRDLCEKFDTQMKPVETSIQWSILDYPDPEVARKKIPELISALDTKLLLEKEELAKAAADNESIMEGEQ